MNKHLHLDAMNQSHDRQLLQTNQLHERGLLEIDLQTKITMWIWIIYIYIQLCLSIIISNHHMLSCLCVCFTVLLLELQTSQISKKIRELQKKEGTEGEHLQIPDALFSLSHLSSVCPRVLVHMSPMSIYV